MCHRVSEPLYCMIDLRSRNFRGRVSSGNWAGGGGGGATTYSGQFIVENLLQNGGGVKESPMQKRRVDLNVCVQNWEGGRG